MNHDEHYDMDMAPKPLTPRFFMDQLIFWASDNMDKLLYHQPTEALLRHQKVLQEMFRLVDRADHAELQEILGHEIAISNGWSLGDLLVIESITGFNIQPAKENQCFPSTENEHLWETDEYDEDDEDGYIQ